MFNRKTVTNLPLLSRLQRGFSPSRWFRGREGLRLLQEGGGRPEWVLSRRLCAYTVLDGSSVPARRRAAFAEMAVGRWSPFSDTEQYVEWIGDRAMVWAWSRERAREDADGNPLGLPRRIVPESLFRGQPVSEGEQLLAMEEGFEGRAWRDERLVASHWWETPPDLVQWNEFRRGAGFKSADRVPDVQQLPLQAAPWGAPNTNVMGGLIQQQRLLLVIVAVMVGAGLLMAQLAGVAALKVSIWDVQKDIAAREAVIAQILQAKEAAQSDAAAVERTLAARPPAGQTGLLAAVARLIPGRWQLLKWEMPDPEHLQLTFRMPGADPRKIVSAWEQSGQFTDVTAEVVRQPDDLEVKARVIRTGQAR